MRTHELKIHPEFFNAVENGSKTFELRVNDREFQTGDRVKLNEWDPELEVTEMSALPFIRKLGGHTGRWHEFTIGYILPVDANRVVFSLVKLFGVDGQPTWRHKS